MKRRNFLSVLFAAPLALKARLARLFARKPVEPCGAPILDLVGPEPYNDHQRSSEPDPFELQFLAKIKSEQETARREGKLPPHCSLLRGHKGPHVLLNLN